jgi:glycosyltransferase involved in cell wall biosynthesis
MTSDPARTRPEVSVIVPARDEEASLGACLQSLQTQTGISFEVIVIDDSSIDRTREIALSFPGVRVITPGPLPPGWTGKNNAVVAGANQANGEWLLFTDADTVHLPGSLAHGVKKAKHRSAALLSYSPEQEVHGFWEHAVMPVIFAELAATYRPSDVCNPALSAAAANGQYLLISREAYDAVGGHTAVATEILEDVALARAVKISGRRIVLLHGRGAVRTRMYRNFAQLREGWTKNLVLLFPSLGRLAILRSAEFLAILGGATIAVAAAVRGFSFAALLAAAGTVAIYLWFLKRIARAHFSWRSNLLALFGLPLFSYLLLRSRLSYRRGRIEWKGRSYTPKGTLPAVSQAGPETRGVNPTGNIHRARGF